MARERLADEDIRTKLGDLPDGWALTGDTLQKTFRCDGFRGSIAFVQKIADIAESMNHHPDMWIRFQRVQLNLTTHSAKGITERDFELARRIEEIAPPKR